MTKRDAKREEPGAAPDAAARASRLAHDLNNLVSVILGYSGLLKDHVASDATARRMAEEVHDAAHQAASLSRQLVEVRRELRGAAAPAAAPEPAPARARRRGSVTVLVLEDDAGVRRLAESILVRGGYQVLLAADGAAAIALCESHGGVIDLLLADLVIPGERPEELVGRASALRPEMKVLYMSGSDSAVLRDGAPFLAKPFTAEVLLERVRAILDAGA